jgi:hypothetical protein
MGDEHHLHDRHHNALDVEVFELHTGKRLGRLVDLSADSFMLFGDVLLNADELFECRLVSEQLISDMGEIVLCADCLWSRPGADGLHCWAGFHIIDLADDQAVALENLLQHI